MSWNEGEKPLTIGIDYDDTYTADPDLWRTFIAIAQVRGHKIVCVTCRRETMDNVQDCDIPGVLTYFTGGAPKDWYMREKGIVVDVWIDDYPRSVYEGR